MPPARRAEVFRAIDENWSGSPCVLAGRVEAFIDPPPPAGSPVVRLLPVDVAGVSGYLESRWGDVPEPPRWSPGSAPSSDGPLTEALDTPLIGASRPAPTI